MAIKILETSVCDNCGDEGDTVEYTIGKPGLTVHLDLDEKCALEVDQLMSMGHKAKERTRQIVRPARPATHSVVTLD